MAQTFDGPQPYQTEVAKTASYTVLAADSGTLFTNAGASGAITFTLPTRAANLQYWFYVVAEQNVTISSAAGSDIVAHGNATASNIIFNVPGHRIGAKISVSCNAAGTLWYVDRICQNVMSVS